MADSRSDYISVFCLCTAFTEFRTLLPESRQDPEWSVTNSVDCADWKSHLVGGGIWSLCVDPEHGGQNRRQNSCEQASVPLVSILFRFVYFFWCRLMKPNVTANFTPSWNLQSFFILWFAAPPPNDKRVFSTETLLCENWKNTAFSHLAPANKLKPGCTMIWRS